MSESHNFKTIVRFLISLCVAAVCGRGICLTKHVVELHQKSRYTDMKKHVQASRNLPREFVENVRRILVERSGRQRFRENSSQFFHSQQAVIISNQALNAFPRFGKFYESAL